MFSLIIPYRNRRELLPRTLRSVVRSSVRPARIYLVDNGSTDASAQVCRDFAAAHPDFPFELLSEPTLGASRARNRALQRVETEWVYFFDSDDELSPDYFQAVQEALAQHPETEMVACATRMVFGDGHEQVRAVQHSASVAHQILSGQLATQGMFVRTALLRRVGGWNEALPKWNDWELGVRLLREKPVVLWLPGAFHRIYQHPASITGTKFAGTLPSLLPALEHVAVCVEHDGEARTALAARAIILAGQLKRQGSAAEARQLLQWTEDKALFPKNMLRRSFLSFLSVYTTLGGRGAWRLALYLLQREKKA